ncbi:MAG: hypothetical protein V4658_03290 [Bacteroidota bacterium]
MFKNLFLKRVIALLCIVLSANLYAQRIQLQPRPASQASFGSKDLWNADLSHTGPLPENIKLRATIQSTNSILLVEALSLPLSISASFTSLNELLVKTASLNYFNPQVQQSDLSSRSFPGGEYLYCLYVLNPVTNEVITQQCVTVAVSLLVPPVLIYPGNKESVQEKNPLLTWLSPGALSSAAQTSYILTLVELYPNQEPADALLRNRPLVYEKNIPQTSLQYPYSAPALTYGKQYAWQVEAIGNTGASYGLTPIWSFTLNQDSVLEADVYKDQSYVDIRTSAEHQVYYAKGLLKIKYSERKYPAVISYRVFDEAGNPVNRKPVALQVMDKENWYDLNFEKELPLKHKQRYRFELYNERDVFKINFVYIDPLRVK